MDDVGLKLIQVGKVKEVYEIEGSDDLKFRFTDKISVFVPVNGLSSKSTSALIFI